MDEKRISYDSKGFIINGKREFLTGGEFHYFRVPSNLWEDRLQKMKRIGANMISVYIPWSMHEPEEGKERWTGDYDLEKFLSLCQKYNLYVLIKPGPYVCAELDFGGHPDWLIGKIARKEIKLRMLDEGYLEMCRRWYKRVSEIINPYLITRGGNIVAIQIENEYDHLIEYGEEKISYEDAVDYFLFLKRTMEELGIDIPKFANEAAFLRGRDIIDTRTYYPNIPGLWMWEFDLFEEKIINSKLEQPDSPVMILELQAGWFAQIGAPIYNPELDLIESVSKSVLIKGASVMNYYMMVGGTTFPFIGARGDVFFLGGLGNITSYDFGCSPVRETGEIHEDKFYWIKGFNRFVREFSGLILESDNKSYIRLAGGGEDIALLEKDGVEFDAELNRSSENFKIYEEGNDNGRFFFIRNLEDEEKNLTINISKDLMGREYSFASTVKAKETRLLPVNFKIPGTEHVINYSTSEVLLSKKYGEKTAFVMFGKRGTKGETCISIPADKIIVQSGEVDICSNNSESVLKYTHSDISIVRTEDIWLILVEENMIGKVEELETGLLIHDAYYIEEIGEKNGDIKLVMQVKEDSSNKIRFIPMVDDVVYRSISCGCANTEFVFDEDAEMYSAVVSPGIFNDKPEFEWTTDWKYKADSEEVKSTYDYSGWVKLDSPMSLEEAGFIEHGYYWYKTQFHLEREPETVFMDYKHNETDRMFIYLNEQLIYKSHNKNIKQKDITSTLKVGMNTITILYANEFHNKSHPHEGDLVKYSGIMNPIELYGKYINNEDIKISLESFYVKKGLRGINEGFHTWQYDDSAWNSIGEARKFVVGRDTGHIIWLRRKFRYDIGDKFAAPLFFETQKADQRLTIYINGKPTALYDILGPQQQFYIPEAYLNPGEENVISIILECPGFYDELQSGYRRGYIYRPAIKQSYIAKRTKVNIKK